MKKIMLILVMWFIVPILKAQSVKSLFKKGDGQDTTIFVTLHRDQVESEKKIRFNIVYNYLVSTKEGRSFIEKLYVLSPGTKELKVSIVLPRGASYPWINAWVTTNQLNDFGLPLFIGKTPILIN
jgi:hypothetical protein